MEKDEINYMEEYNQVMECLKTEKPIMFSSKKECKSFYDRWVKILKNVNEKDTRKIE